MLGQIVIVRFESLGKSRAMCWAIRPVVSIGQPCGECPLHFLAGKTNFYDNYLKETPWKSKTKTRKVETL